MRKLVMATTLGCLAVATAADAHVAGKSPAPCLYGVADGDLVTEVASLGARRLPGMGLV